MLYLERSRRLPAFTHFKALLFSLFIGTTLISCGKNITSTGELSLEGNWQFQNFDDIKITILKNDRGGLLIGTAKGLFQLNENNFTSLGLGDDEIRGVIRLNDNSLLVSIKASDASSEDTTLFKSHNEGESWEPFMNNFGGDGEKKYTWIDTGPEITFPQSDTIFVRGNMSIIRSVDRGHHWEPVWGTWDSGGGQATLVKADTFHSGLIWAGGVNGLSQPYLIKSTDSGNNWEWLESTTEIEGINVEAIMYEVITHIEHPDLVLAGLGGAFAAANNVKKSTDGGESWEVVLEETGVHAFARSSRNPEVIYAGGRDSSTKLFFAVTDDFGETWEKEIFEEGPSPITTNDLAVMTIEDQEILFFGTDQGLFSYSFVE